MPQIETVEPAVGSDPAAPTFANRIDFVLSFLRRRYGVVLGCLLLALPLAGLYLYATPSTYTASAIMMIESRSGVQLQQPLVGAAPIDNAYIESQIGILRSQNVAAYVVRQLRLADEPNFARSEPGLFDKLSARIGFDKILARVGFGHASTPPSEAERTGQAIGAVMGGVDARRVGQSYMLRIDFRWHDPEQAVKVANAMIDAYIFEQLNAKYQANRRSSDWLQERLQMLREQAAAAERAVVEFKAKNNIVAAGGTLMSDKQLAEASAQLATARAHVGELEARLERIAAVSQAYQQDHPTSAVDENVTEAMSNGIINGLRAKYLELINREADWSTRYGRNHAAVANIRNQIRDIRRSIRSELGRIEETVKSEYEIAKRRQGELQKILTTLVSGSTETNQAQIALFSLESAAQSYRKLYDNFLQLHTQSVQQQTYPISDARSLSPASVVKSGPNALKIWMAAIFGGGLFGIGFGALREAMDRGFRTREQVRSVLQTDCLAMVPLLGQNTWLRNMFGRGLNAPSRVGRLSLASSFGSTGPLSRARILQTVIDAPSSPYAEAIRSIKLTVDMTSGDRPNHVIGLTSCLAAEGKSTIAAAVANLIAQTGARVILIDGDLRNPSLSRMMAPDATIGFVDAALGRIPIGDAIWSNPKNKMAFLPAVANDHLPNPTEVLASDAARRLFETLKSQYDYVIVDLAPLVAPLDARAASRLIDSYVLVVEWGATKIDAVQYALRHAPEVQNRIIGTVLNKVDMTALGRYDSYGSGYYYGQNPPRRAMN